MSINFNEDKFWDLKVDADYQHEQFDNGYVFFENEAEMDAFVNENPDLAELDKAIMDDSEGEDSIKKLDSVTVEYDSRGGKELHFGETALEVALAAHKEDSPDFFGKIDDYLALEHDLAHQEPEELMEEFLEAEKELEGYLEEGYTHIYVPEGGGLAGAEVFRADDNNISILAGSGRLYGKTFVYYPFYLEIPLESEN